MNYFAKNKCKNCMFDWMRFIHNRATTNGKWDLYSCVRSHQARMKLYEHKQDYILDENNEQEKSYVKEILDIYAKDIIVSYFNGLQYIDKKCYMLNDEEHFMFSLWCFLSQLDEHKPIYTKLRDKVYSYNSLTDFGRAYYKLYYIATKFCEDNYYTKDFYRDATSKHIEKYL